MTLLEVLSRAGGPSSAAGTTVLVSAVHQGRTRIASYNLMRSLQTQQPRDNPLLTGKETVTVLPHQMIYVVGALTRPGAFPITADQPINVLNAIALARGLLQYANKGQAEIIHTAGNGLQHVEHIHVGRILKHKVPDPQLEAGDILYIPRDGRRKVLMTALQDAAQIVTLGAAYHFP